MAFGLTVVNLLFLTDNFPPERNAPAIRTYEHAKVWVREGHRVTVVTSAPNFPEGRVFDGYANRLVQREVMDGIEVVRVWTYITANEGFLKRTLDYVSFMASAAIRSVVLERPDVVVATSPQFFTALGGWLVAGLKRRPFVFELRDLWPETIVAVGAVRNRPVLKALDRLAGFLYRRADLMVPVTHSFAAHLRQRGIPEDRIAVVTNGVDPESIARERDRATIRRRYGLPENAFVAGYVGTHGLCHGLDTIVDAAGLAREYADLHFLLVGSGAGKKRLLERLAREGLPNVTALDAVPRQDALDLLSAADAAMVLLKDDPVFRTVIPSKIFEAMALGKPIVLGVRGESRDIVVDRARCGIPVDPEDARGLLASLKRLKDDPALALALGEAGRHALDSDFRRTSLARRMMEEIERRFARGAEARSPR